AAAKPPQPAATIQKSNRLSNDPDPALHDRRRDNEEEELIADVTDRFVQKALDEASSSRSGISSFPTHHFDPSFAAGMVISSGFIHSLLGQTYFKPYLLEVVQGLIEHVQLLPLKPGSSGKTYVQLVENCVAHGMVPLALYRHPTRAAPDALPYVYTNPRQGDVLQANDQVYVIKV
ncbi:hypothetical protein HDU91_005074, partial [Kappamyces sp. JEL0680]